jgi:ABC-type sulfate transport system permease subunit
MKYLLKTCSLGILTLATSTLPLLAQTDDAASGATREVSSGAGGAIGGLIMFLVMLFMIASLWKVFTKAGEPGWAAIIPIYNAYILCKIAGKPGWWLILMLIPLVNIIIGILVALDIAKNFSKGAGFGIGLAFLPFIFYPILGFGGAQYSLAPVRAN